MLFSSSPDQAAHFMTARERRRSALGKRRRLGIRTQYQGYCLHPAKGWSLNWEQSCRHVHVFGGTGEGKTVKVCIPNVLMIDNASIVVLDPSGEIFRATSGWKKEKQGYRILKLDLDNPASSIHYDPLSYPGTKHEELQNVARLIMDIALAGEKSSIWNKGGSDSLMMVLLMLIGPLVEKEYRNMGNLLWLLNHIQPGEKNSVLEPLAALLPPQAFVMWKRLMDNTNTEGVDSILLNARTALARWNSPDYCELTSYSSFKFSDLRDEKVILYLTVKENKIPNHALLLGLFFTQLFDFLTSSGDGKYPVACVLEEIGNIPILGFAENITQLRKYRAAALCLWQSPAQVRQRYPDSWKTILYEAAAARLYFAPENPETARELSESLGWQVNESTGRKEQLASPDYIRRMPHELLFLKGQPALKLKLKPYYQIRHLKRKSRLKPPPLADANAPPRKTFRFLDLDALPKHPKQTDRHQMTTNEDESLLSSENSHDYPSTTPASDSSHGHDAHPAPIAQADQCVAYGS